MIGAIIGDIIGSYYEWRNIKSLDFEIFLPGTSFTDDTVLACAIADSILSGSKYVNKLKEYTQKYPTVGYGPYFKKWAFSDSMEPYNSYGNGSAMRVSPIGFAFQTLEEVLKEAKKSAEVTHNHIEGIKGAQATAASIFLAKNNNSKNEIKEFIESQFDYDLSFSIDEIRPKYNFDASCQGSVPQAIKAFLESNNFEHSIRLAISIGGDADTLACINGGIAHAFYGGVPFKLKNKAFDYLDFSLKILIQRFCEKFDCC